MGKRNRDREAGRSGGPSPLQRAEYLLVRAASFVLLSTDLDGAARIASFLGGLVGRVDRRHRFTAMENIRRAYGGSLPEERIARMARRVYERVGVTAAEFLHGPRRLRGRAAAKWFTAEGVEEVRAGTGGGPVVFHAAHLGNWEHLIVAARTAGIEVVPVARPLDNPLLDRWVRSIRAATGTRPMEKYGALRGMVREIRAGRCVGIIADQNGGRHGRLATFFGRPCSTQAAGIALARRLRIPWVYGTLERTRPGVHRLRLGPARRVADDDAAEQAEVEELNRQVEAAVRRRPEDWMWLHRRWRIKADWGFPVEPTEGGRGR